MFLALICLRPAEPQRPGEFGGHHAVPLAEVSHHWLTIPKERRAYPGTKQYVCLAQSTALPSYEGEPIHDACLEPEGMEGFDNAETFISGPTPARCFFGRSQVHRTATLPQVQFEMDSFEMWLSSSLNSPRQDNSRCFTTHTFGPWGNGEACYEKQRFCGEATVLGAHIYIMGSPSPILTTTTTTTARTTPATASRDSPTPVALTQRPISAS